MTTDTSSKVLMELTEAHMETGLRGVPVGYCTTSYVDPQTGLHYVGRPVSEIAHEDPEAVIYLLLNKRFPDAAELEAFRAELKRRRHIDPQVFFALKTLPRKGHPMKWFLHAINTLGVTDATGDFREDCLNLIAKIPAATAAIFRLREGWGDPILPSEDLNYMEDFVRMLGVPGLDADGQARLTELMRVFDVVHLDHGGGNLSTFTGKAVASGLADMYESILAAMCGLAGPRHGKANQECLNFVEECVRAVGGTPSEGLTRELIQNRLANKLLIYGFGHAVLKVEDPRATVLIELGERLCPNDVNFRMVKMLRQVVPPILSQNPRIADPYPNVDLASGSLLHACGLENSDYYTVLFGMSRVVGIAIQVVYERCEARMGRGTPIVRPKYLYSPKGTSEGAAVDAMIAG
ncbi:MAG: citrate (Si)-synthase [Planctomycetota bacterium]|nr:MAG: citrate (Si)-synthase [Planctomycetota bacterium]